MRSLNREIKLIGFFIFSLLWLALTYSCNQADTNKPENTAVVLTTDSIPEILRKISPLFIKKNLKEYSCPDIDSFLTDYGPKKMGLKQIDSSLCRQLFGDYKNEYGDFCNSYFFSIDNPIHEFYPITVIQQFGVAENPVVLLLLDNKGKIVNDLEVADRYGETGGCLSSKFINDSTLIQNFEWNEIGVDTISGNDREETSYLTAQVVITSDGKLIKTEIKRWTGN